MRNVVVLNHFAVPEGHAGATRHLDLFSRLGPDWSYVLVGADRSLFSRDKVHATAGSFRAVRTTPYRGNGLSRMVNWVSYAVGALVVGLRQDHVDVVYASSPHLFTGIAGYVLARLRRAGFVYEIRDLWLRMAVEMGYIKPSSFTHRVFHGIDRFLLLHANEVVVLAEGSQEAIVAEHRSVTSVTLIPNGADPLVFADDESRSVTRSRLGISGIVMIYAGAHGPANGLSAILTVAERTREDLPEVSFLLVGDGVDKPRLLNETRALGLTNVMFHDPVPKSEIPDLLHAADVGLHILADVPLFRYGVSPNKLYDYMAAGLPVITNCPGEVAEIVVDAGAGLAVAPDDLEAAVRECAAASPERLQSWGDAGRDYIEHNRSREIVVQQLRDVLVRAVRR
jgi:glycosyltransferase involved in cell wall biosynthesis